MPEAVSPPPAPAAPAKPAAAPTAPAKVPASPINKISSFSDELDKIVLENDEKEKSKSENKPAKPEVDSKPVDKREAAPVDTTRGGEVDKPETKPSEQAPTKAKELREAYELTKKERDQLKADLEAARKSTSKDDPDRIAITEKLTKEEKRRQELEEEIKHLNYERSSEYNEKYQEPLNKAYAKAYKEIKEYIITEANGNERQATADDFGAVMFLRPGEVMKQTEAWFGPAASEVRALRRQILDLDERASEAVKNYKEKGQEIEKSKTAEQVQLRQKAEALWEQHNKEAVEKYPQFFAPKDGDDEGNKLLESGYNLADLHFNPPKDMPIEKRVGLASQIRHRVAGFARVALELKRVQEKLTAAEAELEEYKESEPGKGDGNRTVKPGPKTWADEIDELASRNGG